MLKKQKKKRKDERQSQRYYGDLLTYFAWNDVSEVASPELVDTTTVLHSNLMNSIANQIIRISINRSLIYIYFHFNL